MRVDLGRGRRRGGLDRALRRRPSWPSSTPPLRHALERSDDVLELGRDDFPLPTLHDRLLGIEDELINGRGFVRLRGDRPAGLQPDRDGDPVLGHRHPPRAAVGAEQARPRARRRHRPGQGHRRPDRPGQRARRHRAAVPLRRLRPRRADVPRERAQRWALGGRQLGAHPQPARRGAARPRRGAVRRAARTTSGASSRTGGKPYYTVPVFTEWDDRLFVRCIPPYIWASQRHPEAPRLTAAAT